MTTTQKSLITLPPLEIDTETVRFLMKVAGNDDKKFAKLATMLIEQAEGFRDEPDVIARIQQELDD